jgi:hypothetical protein
MIRKILIVAGAIAMIALITAGLTLGLPANSTTSAAAATVAAQACNFPIAVSKDNIFVGPKKTLGGRDVTVSWPAPSGLPPCVKVKEYIVLARINFPNTFHDNQIKVDGSKTSATVAVGQTLLNKDPVSAKVTVTAVLEVVATSTGSDTKPLGIN